MSRGNGLLLGVPGSGKQSLTKLASYISGHKIKQIEITKGYNIDSFRMFLKTIMRECSDKDQSITFLFTDNQVIDEIFLEDINNILNSG
jgi:dynein heavy chain